MPLYHLQALARSIVGPQFVSPALCEGPLTLGAYAYGQTGLTKWSQDAFPEWRSAFKAKPFRGILCPQFSPYLGHVGNVDLPIPPRLYSTTPQRPRPYTLPVPDSADTLPQPIFLALLGHKAFLLHPDQLAETNTQVYLGMNGAKLVIIASCRHANALINGGMKPLKPKLPSIHKLPFTNPSDKIFWFMETDISACYWASRNAEFGKDYVLSFNGVKYHYNSLPFGADTAPYILAEFMESLLDPVRKAFTSSVAEYQLNILIYLDDIFSILTLPRPHIEGCPPGQANLRIQGLLSRPN